MLTLYDKAVHIIELAEETTVQDVKDAEKALGRLPRKQREVLIGLAKSIARNRRDSLSAIHAARPTIELMGRLVDKIQADTVIHIHNSESFRQPTDALLSALEPHKEAYLDVNDALITWVDANQVSSGDDGTVH